MTGATPMQLFGRHIRGHLSPFAIGFGTVFITSFYLFRTKPEDYEHTNNKRFAAPFVKDKPADGH